jgi:hypothetical protein
MRAKEWEEKFKEIPGYPLHSFKQNSGGVCANAGSYEAVYSFGKYGSRKIVFDNERFLQRFFDSISKHRKRAHMLKVVARANCDENVRDIIQDVQRLLYQKKFDELADIMKQYIPKPHPTNPDAKLYCHVIASMVYYDYPYTSKEFNDTLEELRSRRVVRDSIEFMITGKYNYDSKYCYVTTDLSDCMYPEVRLVGDIACVEGEYIDYWLVEQFDKFIEDDPFYKYNVNDERRDPSIERLEQRKDAAIKKFIKDMPIYSLAIKEAYGKK